MYRVIFQSVPKSHCEVIGEVVGTCALKGAEASPVHQKITAYSKPRPGAMLFVPCPMRAATTPLKCKLQAAVKNKACMINGVLSLAFVRLHKPSSPISNPYSMVIRGFNRSPACTVICHGESPGYSRRCTLARKTSYAIALRTSGILH